MTPLHGIACFYDVGFDARAGSRKTPIYFINSFFSGSTSVLSQGVKQSFLPGKSFLNTLMTDTVQQKRYSKI